MKIYEKIKAIRKYYGMTQAEFAQKLGISRANYSNIEHGKVNPTQVLIKCLSVMYGVSDVWLTDESQNDLSILDNADAEIIMILEKYRRLTKNYQDCAEKHLDILLELQEREKDGLVTE